MSERSFTELIEGVRQNDQGAIQEFVERFGPHIQRIARIRMRGSHLQRLVESVDICQSVLADFCQRAGEGRFELQTPQQLMALLATMTRNRVLKKVAFHRSQRRDISKQVASDDGLAAVADDEKSPSLYISEQEMLGRVRQLLSPDEQYLLEQRAEGRSWVELANELGGGPDRIRKQAARAAERIAQYFRSSQTAETNEVS